jgi:putative ABC transport system permease protein
VTAAQGLDDAAGRARELIVQVSSAESVTPAAAIIESAMARLHSAGSYQILVPQELLRARIAARRTANWLLFAIGAIALGISGVGIMNIMLANVIERTPEIGVRRAFGARRPDILAQFAMESALLCAAGGVIGVPLGAVAAVIAARLGGWPVSLSATSVVMSLALATAVGLGFGLYPARRAAAIQPVDALRA